MEIFRPVVFLFRMVTVSFAAQELYKLMLYNFITSLTVFVVVPGLLESYSESCYLCLNLKMFFLFSCCNLQVLGLPQSFISALLDPVGLEIEPRV